METGTEGEVIAYPAPDELWAMTFAEANAWRDRFATIPFEDKGGSHPSRYYQDIAVERVMQAIAAGLMRILLTLATGTGKTFIAFQAAWKLFHSRWNLSREPSRRPRILFLADRNILADQAYNAFSSFPEDALVRIAPDDNVVEGEVEAGKLYDEADFNKIIEIKEREKKRVEIFMGQIDQNEKTLVFCATQNHALAVRDLINQMKTSTDPNYCQRVTANDGALGEQHLRDFQDNEKTIPTILTTSQKLSTGVDARNIRNIVLMRSINSMIEFKQIIGRGTRLFDGKDYFTIYDFVKAHVHFSDPEWDGEPVEEEPCPRCGERPCVCEVKPRQPCEVCGKSPCECPKEPCPVCGMLRCICNQRRKVKVKLADRKERNIQHMMATTFWHPDGTPMSAQQFMEMLFGKLPEFFKNEDELRALWSAPDTARQAVARTRREGFRPRSTGRDAEDHRRREKRPVRRARTRGLRDAADHPRGSCRERESLYQLAIHHQAAGLSRLRAVTLRERRRGRTRPRKAHTAAPAEIPQLHRRRRGQPRQPGGNRQSVRRFPAVSLRGRGLKHV